MGFLSSLAAKLQNSQSTQNPFGAVMGINVPSFSLTEGFGSDSVEGLGGLAKSISKSASNLLYATRLIGCVGTLLTNPAALFGTLGQIMGASMGMAAQMGDRVLNAVQSQINQAMGQIKGTVIGSILSIFSFAFAAIQLVKAIKDLYDHLSNLSANADNIFMNDEECSQMFGFIGACLLNKYFGSKIETFTNSVVSKINEKGAKVNESISNELHDVNVIKNYVDNQTFALNKATSQINAFRI